MGHELAESYETPFQPRTIPGIDVQAAMSDDPGLEDAYALDGPDAVRALYRNWADSFESGFLTETGYIYHTELMNVFVGRIREALTADEAVLDVGCGTGIGGVELREHGPWPVDGLDLSPEMLAKAATKTADGVQVYRELIEANVLEPLRIADSSYGGLVSIGTFTHGHVGPRAINELVRIVRPGGQLCLGVNEEFFAGAGFGREFERLESAKLISKPEMVRVPIYDVAPGSHPHADDTALVVCFSPLEQN